MTDLVTECLGELQSVDFPILYLEDFASGMTWQFKRSYLSDDPLINGLFGKEGGYGQKRVIRTTLSDARSFVPAES